MMSLPFGLFTKVSGSGPLGPLVFHLLLLLLLFSHIFSIVLLLAPDMTKTCT